MRQKTLSHLFACLFVCVSLTTNLLSNVAQAQADSGQPPEVVAGGVEYVTRSSYLPMRDGVRIAADVVLPKNMSSSAKLPTLLVQTRYWRGYDVRKRAGDPNQFDGYAPLKSFFTARGYAVVMADVRGTGASFGTNPYPWAQAEIRDGYDIVDWIVKQPWSNGKVGAEGVSYEGSTAQFLASVNHPAVKAVVPRQMEFDVYSENAFPGGVFNDWFVKTWNAGNQMLDRNRVCDDDSPECREALKLVRGVKPTDDDKQRILLKQAVAQHVANGDIYAGARGLTFRDEPSALLGASIDGFSVHTFKNDIERSGAAILGWGSWMDAATADGVLRRFSTLNNPQQAIIGPWDHALTENADPHLPARTPVSPTPLEQLEIIGQFLDRFLKHDGPPPLESGILYYTLGEGKWKATDVWPPEESANRRWWFAENGTLAPSKPAAATGADTYTVDFEASTGTPNRWTTQAGTPVVYGNRAEADKRLLTYTSAPLERDTEITGHPVVTLNVASTEPDGAFFVYLEEVDEKGNVVYVTEGQLRAIHRKTSSNPPYATFGPYHSFRKADAMPLVPGETTEIGFGLNPTSVLIKKGHRIRIAVGGHDKSVFARTPAQGAPRWTVARNSVRASFIDLPTIERP